MAARGGLDDDDQTMTSMASRFTEGEESDYAESQTTARELATDVEGDQDNEDETSDDDHDDLHASGGSVRAAQGNPVPSPSNLAERMARYNTLYANRSPRTRSHSQKRHRLESAECTPSRYVIDDDNMTQEQRDFVNRYKVTREVADEFNPAKSPIMTKRTRKVTTGFENLGHRSSSADAFKCTSGYNWIRKYDS